MAAMLHLSRNCVNMIGLRLCFAGDFALIRPQIALLRWKDGCH